jgi:hypothetical protein
MDRIIVYPASLPQDTDVLNTNKNAMLAFGFAAQAAVGTATVVSGLACTPTAPASLIVNVGPGSIISPEPVDATAYGSLAADTTDTVVKQGINLTSTPFTLTAPVASGQSINYLIEAQFLESDGGATVLPYYNPSNPAAPYSGPSNSGASQNTVRQQRVSLQLKAGTAATTGTQTTPGVDSGWVGLYVITVNYAQTQITSSSIVAAPGAPFIDGGSVFGASQIAGKRIASYTSSGSFTIPNGITSLRVRVWGAGGGGGGAYGTASGGSAGGGGGYSEGFVSGLTAGSAIAITVGGGGAGGNPTPSAGASGGSSSFGSYISASGGGGGYGGNSGVQSSLFGPGGVGTGGALNITGSTGGYAYAVSASIIVQGVGGGTFCTSTQTTGIASQGIGGIFPGGGANGGVSNGSGGTGAGGLVVIEW